MRNKLLRLWLPLSVMAAGATACITEDLPENTGVEAGDPLPQFSVTLNDGATVTTASLRGKVAVIEFFNTSCDDCRRGFPVIQQLYEHYADDDAVEIFCIARDEDDASISHYWSANGLTIPYSPQTGRSVYELFASTGIPRLYIADRKGIITWTSAPEEIPSLQTIMDEISNAGQSR